ncbi:hypothetical protein [Nostoc sp. CMAA1605]|nr:hypothetical protein [Nostoc sp. CMAA1605]
MKVCADCDWVVKFEAITIPNAQCPMPNAQCPMPNAQCQNVNKYCKD